MNFNETSAGQDTSSAGDEVYGIDTLRSREVQQWVENRNCMKNAMSAERKYWLVPGK